MLCFVAVRITFAVHQFLPNYFTGTEQYCFAIAHAMQERGHDVEVLALEPDFSEREPFFEFSTDEVAGLRVRRVRQWMHLDRDFERMEWSHPVLSDTLHRYLEERRPDVLHVFHLRYLGTGLLGSARHLGVRVLAHLMDFWFVCPAVTLRRPDGTLCSGPPRNGLGCMDCVRPGLSRELSFDRTEDELDRLAAIWPGRGTPLGRGGINRVDRALGLVERPAVLRNALLDSTERIFAPSRFLRSVFLDNGFPGDRIEVLRYGVDPRRIADAKTRYRPQATLRCVFLGSIAEHKGTRTAVEAVLGAGDGIELTLHGRESDFPDYSRQLRELVADDPRVRFAGPYERDGLSDVLAEADLLIAPSLWYENTPFVVLEAQMAGVPVVASDLGGMSEIVNEGVDGRTFRAGDSVELGRILRELQSDRHQLQRLRDHAPSVKSLSTNIDEIEAAYRDRPSPG